MTVGIPGTGLGGLFYFLLIVLMPFLEFALTVRRRSSLARWGRVGFHLLILAGMFSVLWGEAWLLDRALAQFGGPGGQEPARGMFLRTGQSTAIASLAVLATLLVGVAVLRFTPLARAPRKAPQSSALGVPRVACEHGRMRAAVIGAGAWGTAMAIHLAMDAGRLVGIVSREDLVRAIELCSEQGL